MTSFEARNACRSINVSGMSFTLATIASAAEQKAAEKSLGNIDSNMSTVCFVWTGLLVTQITREAGMTEWQNAEHQHTTCIHQLHHECWRAEAARRRLRPYVKSTQLPVDRQQVQRGPRKTSNLRIGKGYSNNVDHSNCADNTYAELWQQLYMRLITTWYSLLARLLFRLCPFRRPSLLRTAYCHTCSAGPCHYLSLFSPTSAVDSLSLGASPRHCIPHSNLTNVWCTCVK